MRLRQIDEPGGRYRAGENEQQSGVEERKRRGKKSNLEDAGQKDLFASPDLSGEERKQQIIENQRVLVKHVETGTIRAGTDTIHTHNDLAHFIAPIRKLAQEEMYAIVLDGNDKVINVIKHSKGQKASASVSPWTLAGAVVATPDAKSVWFAHNHPSGDPEPSTSDVHITHSLNEVLDGSGIINMGHAVVGITGHARIMDADGTVQTGTVAPKRMARNKAFPITERRLRFNRPHINFSSPETVRPFLDTISRNAVVLLDSKYNVTGVLPLSDSDLKTLRHPTDNPQGRGKSHQAPGARLGNPAAARIMTALDSTNSSSVILKSSGSPLAMKGTRNLINFFNRGDRINVLDHFTGKEGDYQSAAEQGFPDLNEGGSFYALRKDTNAKGIQSGPLRLKLKPLEQKLGQAIHVLQSETELPSHLYQTVISDKAQGRVRGLFDPDSGDTYLIAANLDNVGEATRTVLHELVGHKGVRGLLGKRLDTVLDEIHRDMSDRLKQALAKRYARQMEGKSEVEANRIVAEEYLAHLAEKDPKNGLLTKVVSMIRNALRRLFPNIKWTDADAVELLSAARGHLKRNGSFNPNGPKGNRYNDAGRAPTFYSAVERSAAAVKSDKLPAQSWLNAIKKGDFVQDEEIRWLGLDLWLDSKQGEKLSKSDVLSFIRENEVSIAEDLATSNTAANEEELEERLDDMRRRFINERIGDYEHGYHLDEIENALNTAREELWDSEYEYNYDELKDRYEHEALDDHEIESLLDEDGNLIASALHEEATWRANNSIENTDSKELVTDHVSYQEKEEAALAVWEDERESDARDDLEAELRDEAGVRYREYTMAGGEDYSELILTLEDNRTIIPSDPDQRNRNPLAHVRFQSFNQNIHGRNEKILFIDEVQSDWHQDGRAIGYQTPEAARQHQQHGNRIAELKKEKAKKTDEEQAVVTRLYQAKDKRDELYERLSDEEGWNDWGDEELRETLQTEIDQTISTIEELTHRKARLLDELKALEQELQSLHSGKAPNIHRMVPDAPLKENWPNLIMKRMIRHAAEQGFDRIAWTSAMQQVERYPGLGQVVRELRVYPRLNKEGVVQDFELEAKDRNGVTRSMVAPESSLAD
ncbi:JAB domain-containing protein [Endozoicomonas sp. ALE010]|uniref:JAB domain-containing protein n=1 Tax=Endozoicomonas sp. ALE010 TaxID=3403081 RepID=UPI003BB5C508